MDPGQAEKFVFDLLRLMQAKNASDLFITADFPPAIKVDGKLTPVSSQGLTLRQCKEICRSIMNDKQALEFDSTNECNFAMSLPGMARFRVNAFVQRGSTGLVFHTIPSNVPLLSDLDLPLALREISMTQRGLVILVGGTGSGKSTSLAAMLRHRNENSYGHIITIEDPIEFVHEHTNCIFTQREVGVDTENWGIALKNTLRQAPDVIMIGEIRERETMDYAVAFAETGHLCLTTLHANNTNQALDRIINFFPEDRRSQVLMDLSLNLRAVISMRLIAKKEGRGRIPTVEILLNSPLISDLILKGAIHELKEVIGKSRGLGMQTFDQSLFELYETGKITYEDALRNADSANDLRLKIKLEGKNSQDRDLVADMGAIGMV